MLTDRMMAEEAKGNLDNVNVGKGVGHLAGS